MSLKPDSVKVAEMDETYTKFRNYVFENRLIYPGDSILLSLSAGKDSMFMLHMIIKLQNELPLTLGIFHLNHLTRGEDSDSDEIFVRNKSEELNIRCFTEKFDFTKNKNKNISFEEQARDIRYSLLKKISGNNGFLKIATAHNLDDNVETIFMRILSGTGIAGLKGIPVHANNIIRPILFAEKNEIYSYLEKNNLAWREDLSNSKNDYLRNYTRNVILPEIRERFPNAIESLSHLSMHAIENQTLLFQLTDSLYPDTVTKKGSETIIDISGFYDNIPLIKLFISRVLSENYGVKMKVSSYGEIIKRYSINSSNMVLYKKESFIIKKTILDNKKIISITDKIESDKHSVEWEYTVFPDMKEALYMEEIKKKLLVSTVKFDYYIMNKNNPDIIFIQPETDIQKIIIRNRRPGDRIKLENGTKKIKEIMIEKKLDIGIKNTIPLIVADNQIAAYLPGLVNTNNNRTACNFHIRNDTKRILAFFFIDY